jgi:hypothetical protein
MIDIISSSVERIEKLKVPVATVARLSNISDTDLRGILNRQRDCPRDKAIRIDAVLKALTRLVEDTAPLPLDLKHADTLRTILDKIKGGELKIVAHEDPSLFANFPHSITIGDRYFAGRNDQGKIMSSVLALDAKSMPLQVAQQVCAKLKEEGRADVQIVISKYRINGRSLDECWGIDWDKVPMEEPEAAQGNFEV